VQALTAEKSLLKIQKQESDLVNALAYLAASRARVHLSRDAQKVLPDLLGFEGVAVCVLDGSHLLAYDKDTKKMKQFPPCVGITG
jgi:hypothetical protein